MSDSAQRVCIFIDGGNFHHLVIKKLGVREQGFSFDEFAHHLAKGRVVVPRGKRFYVGTVREKIGDERSKKAMSEQTRFLTTLRSYGWELKTSGLRTRMEKVIIDNRVIGFQNLLKKGIREIEFQRTREKGIDVKLATDLIVGAVDDQYDMAIVVSSDTDLIPAMDWIRNRKSKRVEYVGFSIEARGGFEKPTKPSEAMIGRSDIQRVLVASDLESFIRPFTMKGKTSLL